MKDSTRRKVQRLTRNVCLPLIEILAAGLDQPSLRSGERQKLEALKRAVLRIQERYRLAGNVAESDLDALLDCAKQVLEPIQRRARNRG